MEYRVVAHLNKVVKQPNKRECSYSSVMRDVSLSVRRTFVRIHYSSYMQLSIIIRHEVETLRRKRRTYNYDIRAYFSCHDGPIRFRMDLKRHRTSNGYAYMKCCPSTSSPMMK